MERDLFFDKSNLRFNRNENRLLGDVEGNSILYYLRRREEKLDFKREAEETNNKQSYVALFEIDSCPNIYFCFDRKRIAFFSQSIIEKVANCKNKICDNPDLVEALINENCTIDLNVIKIIESIECIEFQSIIADVSKIKYGIDIKIEGYLNTDIKCINSIDLSDTVPSIFNFDFRFITKENYLVFGSNDNFNEKEISYKVEDPKIDSYEICIGFDLSNGKSITLCYLDYIIEISIKTDTFERELNIDNEADTVTVNAGYSFIRINIYYFQNKSKKYVLQKSIPYLCKSYYDIKIQKISNFFFFTVNDIFLGSILRPKYTFESSNQILISLKSQTKNSLITLERIIINEIVNHNLMEIVNQINNFKSNEKYYISIGKDYMESDGYGGGRNDTYISKIISFQEAKDSIESRFCLNSTLSREQVSSYKHYIVSNDFELINRYRNVIEIEELVNQTSFSNDDFFYFALVLFGFCIQCRSYDEKEDYTDQDNGVCYSVPVDSGWLICNREGSYFR